MLVDDDVNIIKLDAENYFTTGLMTFLKAQDLVEVSIYPNPTEGNMTLIFREDQHKEVKIFSAAGKLVYTGKYKKSRLDLDLSHHPAGIYFISIMDESATILHSGKIIKH